MVDLGQKKVEFIPPFFMEESQVKAKKKTANCGLLKLYIQYYFDLA